MELGCGSYERGVICPTAATQRSLARARARSGWCCWVGRNLGRVMGVYETCGYMLTMPPEIRILFCFLRLSHWFAFQYCLLSLINTCMKNFAYYVCVAYVIKLVCYLRSSDFHSLLPGLWPSLRRNALFATSSNYMGTVQTPVWIANIPSMSFPFRHLY